MNAAAKTQSLTDQEKGILLTLLYFDIFHYPLNEKEITRFSPEPIQDEIRTLLSELIAKGCIFEFKGFYLLHNDPALVDRRLTGNLLAEKKMRAARKFSALLSQFPFVRSVMLSGSISKGYMDEKSDIDYFIITAKGRLWLVRMAMVLFRRVFLLNSRKYLCTNYFVDNEHLEITEKNIFTAIETSTLKPMYGKEYVYAFQEANQWCNNFLPNFQPENGLAEVRDGFMKKAGERILSASIFNPLERWLRNRFINHWKRAYQARLAGHDFSIAFQSTENVSRSHPEFYQKRVLNQYREKITEFERRHDLTLQLWAK